MFEFDGGGLGEGGGVGFYFSSCSFFSFPFFPFSFCFLSFFFFSFFLLYFHSSDVRTTTRRNKILIVDGGAGVGGGRGRAGGVGNNVGTLANGKEIDVVLTDRNMALLKINFATKRYSRLNEATREPYPADKRCILFIFYFFRFLKRKEKAKRGKGKGKKKNAVRCH